MEGYQVAIAIVVALIAANVAGLVVIHIDIGDGFCEEALGDGAEYYHPQPAFDSQLDCVAPNGTIVRDTQVPPMNITSRT